MKTPALTLLFRWILLSGLLLLSSMQVFAQSKEAVAEPISQGQLEQILAPIALYPDTILSHILVAATYPLEVVQAERWTVRNLELTGAQAVEAVGDKEWDPSVQALVAFPQILKRMSADLEWTQQLGDAFLQDEQQLLASVQILRTLAAQAGSLDEMQEVSVTREDKAIIIEPREREVVYVPYYDTRVVYGPWRWRHHEPIFWDYPYYERRPHSSYYSLNRHSSFYWGPRVSLSFGFFFNTFHWQDRHLVRISAGNYRSRSYYSHSDILSHRNAERWVHNSGRRHAHRNRNIVNRNYSSDNYRSDNYRNETAQSGQRRGTLSQRQSRQERVRNQLSVPQNRVVLRRNNVSQDQQNNNSELNNRSYSASSSSELRNQPTRTSRVVMSSRARPIEEARIEEVRRSPQRSANREPQRSRVVRSSQDNNASARSQQRPVVTSQSSRPAPQVARPSPPQNQAQSKPPKSRQNTSQHRSGPKKAQSGTRRERGQLR